MTTPACRPAPGRSGVALIIALIILAGLLLLGLPFLFSQSESLAGSRSLAYHQAAAVGLSNGEQLAAATVAYGIEHHLRVGGDAWTRQHDDLEATGLMQAGGWITDNIFGLDTSDIAHGVRQARSGAWIEDEHGKLNPNYLSPRAWTILLAQLNIQDWDDDQVLDSEDLLSDPANPPTDDDGRLGLDGLATSNGDNDDGNDFGELAEALANVRFTLPGRRITHLDQLLLADPGHHTDKGPGPGAYTGANGPNGSYGFRRPLTRAELDHLRPYLTLYTPAPGREGLIDLGSIVAEKPYADPNDPTQQVVSYVLLDEDPYDFIRTGSAATWPEEHDNEEYQFSRVHGLNARDYSTSLRLDRFPAANTPVGTHFHGRAMALLAPPRVNLHHALPPILAALEAPQLPLLPLDPSAPSPLPFEHLGTLPADFFRRVDPLSTGVELPPIGIASKGVISVTAGAAVADQLGHVAAERHRRTVMQAVPTQIDLEERWGAQDEFHALMVQRFTSHMVTWPKPTERVEGMRADIALAPGPEDAPIGLGVAPMPSLATGYRHQRETTLLREATHLNIDFRVPFGADQPVPEASLAADLLTDRHESPLPAPADRVSVPGPGSAGIGNLHDALRPDGLRITGAFTWQSKPPAGTDNMSGPLRPVNFTDDRSLAARHLSFWFKPHGDWSNDDALYPILECRSPEANLGDQRGDGRVIPGLPAISGSNELQNRLSIVYDRRRQLVMTVLAPPAIEHTRNWPWQIPFDDLDPTLSAHLDERSLGNGPAGEPAYTGWPPAPSGLSSLAPMQPYPGAVDVWDEASALFTTNVSRAYKPNTIVHLYKLTDPSGLGGPQPFFRKDRWYHLNLVIAGSRPGDVLTIIDGVVGQDVSRTPPASTDAMATGDRLTLPAMPLATELLSLLPQPFPGGGGAYRVPTITVQPVLGLNAEDLFPARGMIRINDEYIVYESVTGNTFNNCQRAQRQNSQTDGAETDRWPLTQQHLPGSLVVPGGFRIRMSQGTLYSGGAQLLDPLGNGDPVGELPSGDRQWVIWARLDHTAISPHPANPALLHHPATADTLPLRLDPGHGVPTQFPSRGLVRVQGQFLAYNGIIGGVLQQVTNLSDAITTSPVLVTTRSDINFFIPTPTDPAPHVILIGFPLDADPTVAGHYRPATGSPTDTRLLQVRHASSGRIEWMQYTHLATGAFGNFFLYVDFSSTPSVYGFGPHNRGQQRTDFVGRPTSVITRLTANHFFPALSQVLPVQTDIDRPGHLLATGDVVTLVPKQPELTGKAIQTIVRYATTDGLDTTGGNKAPDTKNEYFAFDHALDAPLAAENYELLVWPGWSGQDLTPMNPINGLLTDAPLRLDIAADNADIRNGLELAILSRHPLPIVPAEAALLRDSDPISAAATIDALVGGRIDGHTLGLDQRRGLVRGRSTSGDVLPNLATIGAIVEASHDGFFPRPFGLVCIQGEVFAYRQVRRAEGSALGINNNDTRHAVLIGRGLLDLADPTPTVVSVGAGPTRGAEILRPLVSAIPLPIGPVAQLTATPVDHQFFMLDTGLYQRGQANESIAHNNLDAPYAFICNPTGAVDAATVMGLAGGASVRRLPPQQDIWDTEYVTAPWLRGMYNTEPTGAGAAGDIVIGWWPRLPSARPSTPNGAEAPYHRSRRYAWAGFPMAMHGARLDLAGIPAEVTLDTDSRNELFVIEARVAALRDHDWTRLDVAFTSGDEFALSPLSGLADAIRTSPEFQGREVNGAELRVTWRYAGTVPVSSSLDAIAEAGSRGPFIQSAFLRWRAPMAVLAVEEAR